MKPKILLLTGPTASGKTKLAVELARRFDGEILSADSRQVFRGMDLGSGKDLDEYGEIPHHGIDILEAGAEFSASDFQRLAMESIAEILERGRLPILCGGTGHYLKALVQDYPFEHSPTDRTASLQEESLPREKLLARIKEAGLLEERDWTQASPRHMVRRLEQLSRPREENPLPRFGDLYDYCGFYLDPPRELVRERIDRRLSERLKEGMIEEVRSLLAGGISKERMLRYGLEYKLITLYLKGELSKEEMTAKLATEIKRYAKRQMTFIRYMIKEGVRLEPVVGLENLTEKARGCLGR